MILRAILCLMLMIGPSWGAPWPGLYDVAGVATDDVLNVRGAPFASAELVGTLPPDARDVEVVALNEDETWGLVNVGETSGWVSLAFLAAQVTTDPGRIPSVRHCFGTEPFWSASIQGPALLFSTPDAPGQAGLIAESVPNANLTDRFALRGSLLTSETGPLDMTFLLRGRLCSDGMSDRSYGIEVDLVLADGDDIDGFASTQALSGCCSLVAPSQ